MWAPNADFEPHDGSGFFGRPERQGITALQLVKGACYVGLAALVIFLLFPNLDLAVARLLYGGDRFIGKHAALVDLSRQVFNLIFYATCAVTLVGLFMAGRGAAGWLGLPFSKWLFVTLCFLIGPLVITNLGLKDHWGRARPRDVIEFGGAKAYTPPFPPADQCQYNCSFVSGEASTAFIVFFALAFLFEGGVRNALIKVGIASGLLAGLVRMLQGGHFLSDVIFAGVFMALTVGAMQLLFDAIATPHAGQPPDATEETSA